MLRFGLVPSLFTLLALPVLIGLGTWQLERRAWKHELMAQIATRGQQAPQDVALLAAAPEDVWRYAPARADGEFLTPSLNLYAPKGTGVPGVRVVSALKLSDGRLLIVDRGYPGEAGAAPGGAAVVTGILRPAETEGWFTPQYDPQKQIMFLRDPAAMAAALGFNTPVLPMMLEADSATLPGQAPPGRFQPQFSDNHLAYAVTWYSFAAILSAIFLIDSRRRAIEARRGGA